MANTLNLEIVTPTAVVYSKDVHMVTLPAADGQIGVYPQHVPLQLGLQDQMPLPRIDHELPGHVVGFQRPVQLPGLPQLQRQEVDARLRPRSRLRRICTTVQSPHAGLVTSLPVVGGGRRRPRGDHAHR